MKSTYTSIDNRLFSENKIAPTKKLTSVIQNKKLIEEYKLESITAKIPKLLNWKVDDEFSVLSQAYAGHQFGGFSILWDWRAHIIKEIEHNGTMYDIQLKGSGRTEYSRGWDGKANLSSMLREYIMSQALFSLGVATNRAVGVYTTGEEVWRDWDITGAILVRLAKSHIRIGTFEYVSYLDDYELLEKFTMYCIERHFPKLSKSENKYYDFVKAVWNKQIDLIINWMRVGFIHWVMNTDNSFISGETLDYGPCAFINNYNPQKVFSSIDRDGRYSFLNQKSIIIWNLTRLIETLLPLIDWDKNKALEKWNTLIEYFTKEIQKKYSTMMHSKIWLRIQTQESKKIILELLVLLETNKLDYTNSFVSLEKHLEDVLYSDKNISVLKVWIIKWKVCIINQTESISLIKKTNPKVIPRNHLVEKALESARNWDMNFINNFLDVLENPYKTPSAKIFSESEIDDEIYQTFCGT